MQFLKYVVSFFALMVVLTGAKIAYSFTIPPCLVPMLECKEPCYPLTNKTERYDCLDECDCDYYNPKCKAMGSPPDNCDEEEEVVTTPNKGTAGSSQ